MKRTVVHLLPGIVAVLDQGVLAVGRSEAARDESKVDQAEVVSLKWQYQVLPLLKSYERLSGQQSPYTKYATLERALTEANPRSES